MTTAGQKVGTRIGSGFSTRPDPMDAALEAFEGASAALGGSPVTLGFLFFSPQYVPHIDRIASPLLAEVGAGTLLGTTTEAPIGNDRELEDEPGISLWLAHLPQAEITPFTLSMQTTPDGTAMVGFPLMAGSASAAFLIADGFSFPTQALLTSLNGDHPKLPVIGGQASGGMRPGEHLLIAGDRVTDSGAVGALVSGGAIRTLVSQGCRPIGEPFVVTQGEGNIITELGGRPAIDRMRESIAGLSDRNRERAYHNGLHIGIAIEEHKEELQPGDFLIRSVLQANMHTGEIAIGDLVRVGQMVQFQLRDAESADLDLELMLEEHRDEPAAGSLLFTCNGRGQGLFGEPSHDAAAIRRILGDISVAGMFCQGEIGPIGGRNFLHGYTASIALFG